MNTPPRPPASFFSHEASEGVGARPEGEICEAVSVVSVWAALGRGNLSSKVKSENEKGNPGAGSDEGLGT